MSKKIIGIIIAGVLGMSLFPTSIWAQDNGSVIQDDFNGDNGETPVYYPSDEELELLEEKKAALEESKKARQVIAYVNVSGYDISLDRVRITDPYWVALGNTWYGESQLYNANNQHFRQAIVW